MERVGFIPRLGACLIDLGIFAGVVHLFLAVDVLINVLTPLNVFGVVSLLASSLLLIGLGAMEVLLAWTPGKRLAGLIIARDDGRPATRRTLARRWAIKHMAVFLCAPTLILWTFLSPHNVHLPLPAFIAPGVLALAIIDTVLTAILLLLIVGGCFLAIRPHRQALHDLLGGTAVFRRDEVLTPSAFSAVVDDSAPAVAAAVQGSSANGAERSLMNDSGTGTPK